MIRAFRKTLAGSLIWDGRGLRNKTGLLLLALVATAEQKALPAQQGEKQGSQAGAGGSIGSPCRRMKNHGVVRNDAKCYGAFRERIMRKPAGP